MEVLLDFWPLGSDGAFALVFALLTVALLGGARLAQTLIGSRHRPARTNDTSDAHDTAEARRDALALDVLPRAEDAPAIALLRGGEAAVAEALLAGALAAGWLHQRDDAVALLADATPRDAADRMLLEEVARQPLTVAGAMEGARRTAAGLAPALRARLEQAGWMRANLTLAVARLLPLGATALLWVAAEAHVALRAAHHGAAPTPPWLAIALVLVTLAGVALAVRTDPRSPGARDFLLFVEEATVALREDVRARRTVDAASVKLAVALDGLRAVPWHPLAEPLAARASSALATAMSR